MANPVILVHGIGDTGALFRTMSAALERDNRAVHAIDLTPNQGDAGIDRLAAQLAEYIGARVAPAQAIDLVGFSMGGIVCRYYLQRLDGLRRVERFVSLASPHRGTWSAFLRNNTGARQMRRGSRFLEDLNRDAAVLDRIRATSVWTPWDLMILPASSSALGRAIRVPVAAHALMPRDRRVLELVRRLLDEDMSPP
jgi:triacylglycerol lipase